MNANADRLHLLLDQRLDLAEKLRLLLPVDLLDAIRRSNFIETVAYDVTQDSVGERVKIAEAIFHIEVRNAARLNSIGQRDV